MLSARHTPVVIISAVAYPRGHFVQLKAFACQSNLHSIPAIVGL
jgi:hypothetical protein